MYFAARIIKPTINNLHSDYSFELLLIKLNVKSIKCINVEIREENS